MTNRNRGKYSCKRRMELENNRKKNKKKKRRNGETKEKRNSKALRKGRQESIEVSNRQRTEDLSLIIQESVREWRRVGIGEEEQEQKMNRKTLQKRNGNSKGMGRS